jgi:hypothetical protein
MPGDWGSEGNQTAAQLARYGSKCPFIGPDPACIISGGIAKRNVRDWAETTKNTGSP